MIRVLARICSTALATTVTVAARLGWLGWAYAIALIVLFIINEAKGTP